MICETLHQALISHTGKFQNSIDALWLEFLQSMYALSQTMETSLPRTTSLGTFFYHLSYVLMDRLGVPSYVDNVPTNRRFFFILPFAALSFGRCKSLLIARYPRVTERYRALLHSWFKGKIKQWGRTPAPISQPLLRSFFMFRIWRCKSLRIHPCFMAC
jgi:hypothetical protein